MAVTLRSNLGNTTTRAGLVYRGAKAVFMEALKTPRQQFWQDMVTEVTSDQAEERFESVGNLKSAAAVDEYGTIPTGRVQHLYTTTIRPTKVANGFEFSYESSDDELYGFINATKGQQMVASLIAAKEKHVADVYYAGFTDTGADGVSTFKATHPLSESASYNDNLASGAISNDNLESAINHFNTIYDQAGRLFFTHPTHIVLNKNYQFKIAKILESALIAFELSNTKNVLNGVSPLRVVLNPYLYDVGGVSPWYLLDKDIPGSGCHLVKRKGYTFEQKVEPANQSIAIYVSERYLAKFVSPGYGIVGSPGS